MLMDKGAALTTLVILMILALLVAFAAAIELWGPIAFVIGAAAFVAYLGASVIWGEEEK